MDNRQNMAFTRVDHEYVIKEHVEELKQCLEEEITGGKLDHINAARVCIEQLIPPLKEKKYVVDSYVEELKECIDEEIIRGVEDQVKATQICIENISNLMKKLHH